VQRSRGPKGSRSDASVASDLDNPVDAGMINLSVVGGPMSRAEDGPAGKPGPSPGDDLTKRQRKIVQAIQDSIEKRGFPPSLREIGDTVELKSTSGVAHQLAALEAKGVLRRDAGRSRAIELCSPLRPAHPRMPLSRCSRRRLCSCL
jgi:LexA DNA binding domain-containing protein